MSFGEYVNAGGFIQKTSKVDPIITFNHVYPRRKQLKKILEDTRRCTTEAWAKWPQKWASQPKPLAGRPALEPARPPPPLRLHLHRSLSRFDPRAHVGRSGLYISAITP